MRDPIRISRVRFTSASNQKGVEGLLGWASCILNDALRIDGITIHRTLSGDRAVSFPTRKDRWGRKHSILRPLNNRVRRDLEVQILRALDLEENAP